jgi:tetratricopeptide (TPR) repeat protein
MTNKPARVERPGSVRRVVLPAAALSALAILGFGVLLALSAGRTARIETRRALAHERRCDSLLEVEVRDQRLVSFAPSRPPHVRALPALRRALVKMVLVPVAVPMSVSAGWQRLLDDYRQAGHTYRALLRLERAYGDVVGQACEWTNLGKTYQSLYKPDSASLCYARSYGLYRLSGSDPQALFALVSAGQSASDAGDTTRATRLLALALLHYAERGDRQSQAWVLADMGGVRMGAGNHEAALDDYTSALDRYSELDSEARGRSEVLANLSIILGAKGEDWFRSRCAARGQSRAGTDSLLAAVRSAAAAELSFALGPTSDSSMLQWYITSAESCRKAGDSTTWAEYLNATGMYWQRLAVPESAIACRRKALAIWQALGDAVEAAAAQQGLAESFGAASPDSAFHYYRAVLDYYDAAKQKSGQSRTLWNMQLLYRETGEDRFRELALGAGLTADEAEALLTRVRKAGKPSG